MSHSAATMGEFGNLILGKDEDKGCERLRKRIRQAKEEEEEGDDNNKVQWDTGICDETTDTAHAMHSHPSSWPHTSPCPYPTSHLPRLLWGHCRHGICFNFCHFFSSHSSVYL